MTDDPLEGDARALDIAVRGLEGLEYGFALNAAAIKAEAPEAAALLDRSAAKVRSLLEKIAEVTSTVY